MLPLLMLNQMHDFLSAIAHLFRSQNAFVCQTDHVAKSMNYMGLPQAARDRLPVERYVALLDEDPRTPIFRANLAKPVHCGMAVSRERLQASRVYRDYLKPLGIEYTLVIEFPIREGVTNTLGLTRAETSRKFDESDCDLLTELSPHLSRAFSIRQSLHRDTPSSRQPAQVVEPSCSDEEILQRLFALPPSQARLMTLLFQGHNIKSAAILQGITEGSARQYLKKIFEKTGAQRQADLIRMAGQALKQSA